MISRTLVFKKIIWNLEYNFFLFLNFEVFESRFSEKSKIFQLKWRKSFLETENFSVSNFRISETEEGKHDIIKRNSDSKNIYFMQKLWNWKVWANLQKNFRTQISWLVEKCFFFVSSWNYTVNKMRSLRCIGREFIKIWNSETKKFFFFGFWSWTFWLAFGIENQKFCRKN